ncbi:ABC transporter ATP-binding protein [Coraliomargarita parva]|uniref:ABC transporter ATP-binding protein n=1 Tax=Coraliomargarita parva TaxID=3014050 RepID=UPI0022B3D284|nr:ABC transporter ATP-binding protein [Coraliomargarita parva]
MQESTAQLVAEALQIGYHHKGEDRCVARNLQLSLHAGEFVCLLGPNGAGKSTLIRTLSGMQGPLSGDIRLQGQSYRKISPRERARLVSVVLTETIPAGLMDAYSLVSLGRHPYSGWLGGLNAGDRDSIDRAFAAVGAQALAGRQVAELSDGERQKISIARALAQEAKVMLLDEPTAFLDLPRRVELMTLLRDLAHARKMALLLSTHDLELALRFADKLWVLTPEGELIQGYPESIALSKDFARVFASERLDWDAASGSFRAHPVPCLFASVNGEGIEANWTRRALERLGFGMTGKDTNAAFSVRIECGTNQVWKVRRNGSEQSFERIDRFIDWVRSENWT